MNEPRGNPLSSPTSFAKQQNLYTATREETSTTSTKRAIYLRATAIAALMVLVLVATTAACPINGASDIGQCPLYPSPHLRMGVNVAKEGGVTIDDYDVSQLHAGWYHDYNQQVTPSHPAGMNYHQMLRTSLDTSRLPTLIGELVDANLGTVWVLGNEPDRYGQDEMTPAEYAAWYHDVYTFLKERDPTSRVAVGAIVQATPIRLRYLDMVLAEYEDRYGERLPTDIWTLHNFLLPENCSWGADIPPGLEEFADEAVPCLSPITDHANSAVFQQRIRDFRQWMKGNGYRDYPLIISEYGILLSPIHGFTYPVVRDYMLASFDFILNTTDSELGYPRDSNRLVQQLAWFSLNFYAYSISTGQGLNGNLYDHESRLMVELGHDYAAYAADLVLSFTDLQLSELTIEPIMPVVGTPITVTATVRNGGGVAAENVQVRFWQGNPATGGQLLGTVPVATEALPDCGYQYHGHFQWNPTQAGAATIFAELIADNLELESNEDNNLESISFLVEPIPTGTITPTPTGTRMPDATVTSTPTVAPTATPTLADQTSVTVVRGTTGQLRYTATGGQRITVDIGPQAVEEETTFVLTEESNPQGLSAGFVLLDQAFTISALRNGQPLSDFQLHSPIVVSLDYSEPPTGIADNGSVSEDDINLYYYDEKRMEWHRDGVTLLRRDFELNCIQVVVAHLTEFALLFPTNEIPTPTPKTKQIYLPVVIDQ